MTTQERIEKMLKKSEVIMGAGGPKAVAKQHEKGKMTARERIAALLDEGSFVELDRFVRHRCNNFGQEKKDLPGEGVTTGYGTVDGRLVYVFAQDFTVEGGSLGEMHANKIAKVQKLALKMGAPCVGLNDSGGARIQEAIDALGGYGKLFFNNTISSGVIPQISAIMGPSAGGAVYSPALTDFIYMVKETSKMFITGPLVVKSVTGEEVTQEQLGGAMTHNSRSGVANFAAEDDADCIQQIRYLLSFLPSNNMETAPIVDTGDDPNRTAEELNSICPDNSNAPYDMYDVIKAIVDNGEYYENQKYWAQNIITCFARMDGETVGIIANQPKVMAGCLDINASVLTPKLLFRRSPWLPVKLTADPIWQCAPRNWAQTRLSLGRPLKSLLWDLLALPTSSSRNRIRKPRRRALKNMLKNLLLRTLQLNAAW